MVLETVERLLFLFSPVMERKEYWTLVLLLCLDTRQKKNPQILRCAFFLLSFFFLCGG